MAERQPTAEQLTPARDTGRTARKARNLEGYPHCVVTVPGDDLDLVVEGVAPTVVVASGKEKGFSATRWRF